MNFFRLHFFKKLTPPQLLVLFFFSLITIGAILLTSPLAVTTEAPLSFLNAYFTSTSAVCVTGLVVVDTSTTFTLYGQIVVLLLIQFGALGIMTTATVIYVFLKKRLSVRDRLLMREALNQDSMSFIKQTIKKVVILTFTCEAIGAVILSIRFIPMYGAAKGIWHSVFHAVSAFCNAGFDINQGQFTSLTAFASDPLVVLTIAGLIIVGGLGFAVITELGTKKKNKRLTLHSKVVLVTTASLLIGGTILFFIFEMNNPETLGNMSMGNKVLASFFQSVTTRTAGFNTINQSALSPQSIFISSILMFIGASPASTGGGIKTTTFAIVILSIVAIVKGTEDINVNKRRITKEIANKAMVVATIGIITLITCTVLLLAFESNKQGITLGSVLFESASAFGTVGLSTGITQALSNPSRIVLIITMFAGRVGPLTLLTALFNTKAKNNNIKMVSENIIIG